MNKFTIIYSKTSKSDIDDLANYITDQCKAPKTAAEYTQGIFKKINSLKNSADSYALYNRKSLQQYGWDLRRINYKKMAIIYTIHGNTVLIRRIIPGSMITCI
jgi:plasmid stabilization system protein ParE